MKKVTDENLNAEAAVETPVPAPAEIAFTKEAIMKSKRWAYRRDALSFLLEDGKEYTHQDVETILNDYMKGQVK